MEKIIFWPSIVMVAAVVLSLFYKGYRIEKMVALLIIFIGGSCICADSMWWRIGFIAVTGLACGSRDVAFGMPYHVPFYNIIALNWVCCIIVKVIIWDCLSCNPMYWMIGCSLGAGYFIVQNSRFLA